VYFTAYFTLLKNASEFDSIKEGISTAEDVSLIDPSFELNFTMSKESCPSCSYLANIYPNDLPC